MWIGLSSAAELDELAGAKFEPCLGGPKAFDEIFVRIGLVELSKAESSAIFRPHQRESQSLGGEGFADTRRPLKDYILPCHPE